MRIILGIHLYINQKILILYDLLDMCHLLSTNENPVLLFVFFFYLYQILIIYFINFINHKL